MHNSDFNPGAPHAGVYFMSLTIVLEVITASTSNSIAAWCTILAALSTCALNLKRWMKDK